MPKNKALIRLLVVLESFGCLSLKNTRAGRSNGTSFKFVGGYLPGAGPFTGIWSD
jgi:hypothetical protein